MKCRRRDSKIGGMEYRTVSGAAFLALVLRHVLPKGLRRARNYGFLHPNSKLLTGLLKLLVVRLATRQAQAERGGQVCY